ncbi:MAG: tRNA dihydrouridine(20/20a) synthase DusA [Pseudomonadota bacterium]
MIDKYHKVSVAPMMDWTDRHCRFFHRQLSKRAVLYTEMVTADAVIHGDRARLIGFDAAEHPLVLQLGGSDPARMAEAASIGAAWGYDAININVGCPSDRVQSGRFGACLMAEPETVAACVDAMVRRVDVPVTVKCRIGIDDQDSEADLDRFIDIVADAGCDTFIVHARKAWLSGLSPKQNRDVPPLDYGRVLRLKDRRPDLTIVLNGGITTLAQAGDPLETVDGVMLGRAAYQNPFLLAEADRTLFGDPAEPPDRLEVVDHMTPYIQRAVAQGTSLHAITRHMLGLFQGQPGARAWRRHLSENASRRGADDDVVRQAADLVRHALASRQRLDQAA